VSNVMKCRRCRNEFITKCVFSANQAIVWT